MSDRKYLDCELYLPSLDVARLSWSGREYEGKPRVDAEVALELGALEYDPLEYGRRLYDAVCAPGGRLRSGLKEAVLEAGRAGGWLRLRLHLSPELPNWVHGLYWELLAGRDQRLVFGRSPETAFSRYCGVAASLGKAISGRPRLLAAISAPSDIGRFRMAEIDREGVRGRLESLFAELAGEIDAEFLEPPVTLERLRERMRLGKFHLLHVFGHGVIGADDSSALVLESEDGATRMVSEGLLTEVFLGERELRFVALVACHGGASASRDNWSGLAGRLVQRGIPAVLGMRRAVSVDDAHRFTSHLYRQLVATRRIDAAVNEARQQLYLSEPSGIEWSSPILFQRLTEGELWTSADEEAAAGNPALSGPAERQAAARPWPSVRFTPRRLRRPFAWVAPGVWALYSLLRFLPAPYVPIELEAEASRVAFRLAKNSTVLGDLSLREIGSAGLATLRTPGTALRRPIPGLGRLGFLLRGAGDDSRMNLQAEPFRSGARLAIENQGDKDFRLSIVDSKLPLQAVFAGEVTLKRIDAPREPLSFAGGEAIRLEPDGGSLEIDLGFIRLDGEEIAKSLPIDRLALETVEERVSPEVTTFERVPSVVKGILRLPATGAARTLSGHDLIDSEAMEGVLADLVLKDRSLRFTFRGKAAGLAVESEGKGTTRYTASRLDGWMSVATQSASGRALAWLALANVLLFVFSIHSPRRHVLVQGGNPALSS